MTDEQIDLLWVDLSIDDVEKLKSPVAVRVKGGKGSGKTHLLRHYSFPLQQIRYERENKNVLFGIKDDGYLGIYLRCGSLNASRFQGQNQSSEAWNRLFEYAFELLLGHELIHILQIALADHADEDKKISEKVFQLFGAEDQPKSLRVLENYVTALRRRLDLAVNNCALGGNLAHSPDAKILLTRGELIFGLPQLVSKIVSEFRNTNFVYFLDELENFTAEQQCYVNTLIREKEPPASFKTGVRKYGVKTNATLAGEDLREGSDFETLPLDEKLRDQDKYYKNFLYELLDNRLRQVQNLNAEPSSVWARNLFLTFDSGFDSENIKKIVERKRGIEPPYISGLRNNLRQYAVGLSDDKINSIISNLRVRGSPLVEKVNILNFYKDWRRIEDLVSASEEIQADSSQFVNNPGADTRLKTQWSLFQQNIVHQLLKDYGVTPYYAGIDSFIEMSEGMPRNYIYILKQIYDWALFKGERLVTKDEKFSLEVQQKGVKKASDWFFQDMRKAGRDGLLVQEAIKRLAELFKVNHYAEKPVECSLIMFGGDIDDASEVAKRVISIAEERSFLIKIEKGHKDKNFGHERPKYQLSKMLCPRWDLPISARGATEFNVRDINLIFDCENFSNDDFKELLKEWQTKTAGPPKKNEQAKLF